MCLSVGEQSSSSASQSGQEILSSSTGSYFSKYGRPPAGLIELMQMYLHVHRWSFLSVCLLVEVASYSYGPVGPSVFSRSCPASAVVHTSVSFISVTWSVADQALRVRSNELCGIDNNCRIEVCLVTSRCWKWYESPSLMTSQTCCCL